MWPGPQPSKGFRQHDSPERSSHHGTYLRNRQAYPNLQVVYGLSKGSQFGLPRSSRRGFPDLLRGGKAPALAHPNVIDLAPHEVVWIVVAVPKVIGHTLVRKR